MRISIRLSVTLVLGLFLGSGIVAHAFLDEIEKLRQELKVWEQASAADLSDVIGKLDDLTGPVFRDVASSDWFNSYVSSLADWDIVSGYKDENGRLTGEFQPANPVTVSEILKMSFEAAKIPEEECVSPPLHPDAGGHWGVRYVSCAEKMQVRLFDHRHPVDLNRPATRAEVLTIIHDVFEDDITPLYAAFRDTAGHPYEADIAHASLYGIVSGDTDEFGTSRGTFRPNDPINRAEAAKIVYQRVKVLVAQGQSA